MGWISILPSCATMAYAPCFSSRMPLPLSPLRTPRSLLSNCKFRRTMHCTAFSVREPGPEVPNWAYDLVCRDNMRCCDGECEYLHLSHGWESRTRLDPSNGRGKLIICAGPERSGSTWLFNAIRFLLEESGERVHSYWMHTVSHDKLQRRGFGQSLNSFAHLLVKTHDWSENWDPATADFIALTERDICGIVNSYLRVGWISKDITYLKQFITDYLEDHRKWRQVAHLVIQYDDLADVGGSETSCLNQLCGLLGLDQINVRAVSDKIRDLPVPQYGCPDPITKLWPRHTASSDQNRSRRPYLTEEECRILKEHAALFLTA